MTHKTAIVVGAQWGDEGKGKVIDYLAGRADVVARAQGGNNAGHTVVANGKKYALQLVPSGVLSPGTVNLIASGVVFDPEGFFAEIERLEAAGVDTSSVFISDRAHIVLPYHKELDRLSEQKKGEDGIGTTLKGIGPCYMDKTARVGLRVCDMLNAEAFKEKLEARIDAANERIVQLYGGAPLDKDETVARFAAYAEKLAPRVRDTGVLLGEALAAGKKVLFEGAQGAMLDIDAGTYPYVTSSHPVAGGFGVGTGVGFPKDAEVVGIVKAYTTRVGAGPFVTELENATGDLLRERGHEFGTVTGRPRRCGWLDGVVLRYSARLNGMTGIALMLLDVLDAFDEINLCEYYEYKGEKIEHFPASLDVLEECKPIYRKFKGWKQDLTSLTSFEQLPDEAKEYIAAIESICGVPVKIVSVGPGREQTIVREEIFG